MDDNQTQDMFYKSWKVGMNELPMFGESGHNTQDTYEIKKLVSGNGNVAVPNAAAPGSKVTISTKPANLNVL